MRRRRRLVLALAALLLLGSCGAVGLSVATRDPGSGAGSVTARADVGGERRTGDAVPGAGTPERGLQRSGDGADGVTMTVTGSTTGLVPGRAGQVLPVTVTNPPTNPAGTVLSVTDVRVDVVGPAGSCPPEDLVVRPYSGDGRHTAARGRSVVVPLAVAFLDRPDRDQSDCAGRTFPLALTVTAGVRR